MRRNDPAGRMLRCPAGSCDGYGATPIGQPEDRGVAGTQKHFHARNLSEEQYFCCQGPTRFMPTLWMERPIDHPIAQVQGGGDTDLISKKEKGSGNI